MFSFDPKSRILKVQKIPESELELNLLEYQRESYNKYVTETVYNDMQYLRSPRSRRNSVLRTCIAGAISGR